LGTENPLFASTLENPINNNNFKDQDEEIKAVEEEIKAEIP
jgi:hypothetical protein